MQPSYRNDPNMDGMEIMMKMMGFRRLRLKTKEKTFYSSLLGYIDSRKS